MPAEFNYIIRISYDRCVIRDVEHRRHKLDLDRWIATHISELGTDATWLKGKREIKKASLYFVEKF